MSCKNAPDDNPVEIVTFSTGDPENPKNWSRNYKRLNVAMICLMVFSAVLGSSLWAPAESQIRTKYGTGPDVTSLGLTLFVLGFALGPLLWGPLAEMYGRKLSYSIAWPIFIATLAPSAWADNVVVIIFFRFLAGCAASAPLNNGGSIVADLYNEVDLHGQAISMGYFVFSAFCGPVVAPVAGFFLSTRFPKELWVLRLEFFLAIAASPLVLLLPETHAPTILAKRAKKMRKSGNTQAWAPQELSKMKTAQLIRTSLTRPSVMLVTEPIVFGASVWMALSYGILYFSFEAYPVVFLEQHNIPVKFGGLPFIPVIIGMASSVLPFPYVSHWFQKLRLPAWMGDANDTESPESRLKLALVACICLPISSFWLAWTSGPETHWIAPALSGIPFGFANLTIFFTFSTYIAHSYTLYTASANAANVFVRSTVAAIFPVVAHSIIDSLGTKWGISMFGFLSLGLMPIPIIFLRNGKRLRENSPFAQEALALMRKMESQKKGRVETLKGDVPYEADEKHTQVPTLVDEVPDTKARVNHEG